MIDPKLIRADLAGVVKNLKRRGFKLSLGEVTVLETRRKDLQVKTQELQGVRNNSSKAIGQA
ncbi:MAG: serine--tRNA ligase, partial [Gammaproteobacteria bacterium]|nr:serine--tRNA ligase [Gammaproteobacteria bacterium]